MKEKPFLLLSNDDGFAAKGIQELIKVISQLEGWEMLPLAPETEIRDHALELGVPGPVPADGQESEPVMDQLDSVCQSSWVMLSPPFHTKSA